jgi:ABC-type uncharacterized transport system substrate-binding protein
LRLARPRIAAVASLAAGLLASGGAAAHPHVFVDAHLEIVFDRSGRVTALRHIWQFDRDFSQMATLNLDRNNDGKLTQDELDPLAQINMDSLKEYDYFTYLLAGGRKLAFAPPQEYFLNFHAERLTLYYTLPLKTPQAIYSGKFEVYDPEYFVAFTFDPKTAVKLDGAPAGCTAHYQPPHELDSRTMGILAQIPIEQHDLPADLLSAAAALANVIDLKCPAVAGAPPPPPDAGAALDAANALSKSAEPEATPSFQEDFQAPPQPAAPAARPAPPAGGGGLWGTITRWFTGGGS